jgi:hypothetical protein
MLLSQALKLPGSRRCIHRGRTPSYARHGRNSPDQLEGELGLPRRGRQVIEGYRYGISLLVKHRTWLTEVFLMETCALGMTAADAYVTIPEAGTPVTCVQTELKNVT